MFENKTEQQAKEEILKMVEEYCNTYHNQKKAFQEGDRIPYASRVYDSAEMVNLVDSSLEFWFCLLYTSGYGTDLSTDFKCQRNSDQLRDRWTVRERISADQRRL